jgi:hypothetical protein
METNVYKWINEHIQHMEQLIVDQRYIILQQKDSLPSCIL